MFINNIPYLGIIVTNLQIIIETPHFISRNNWQNKGLFTQISASVKSSKNLTLAAFSQV